MQNLRLQTKLATVIVVPALLLLTIAAIGLLVSNDSGIATGIGLLALVGAVACAAIGFLFVTPTLRSVRTVTEAARDLSDRRLPAMLEGEESTFGFEQLNVRPTGDDDLDQIAESIEKIHAHSASSFYEQQEKVRIGLSQVVSNLARRNQNLLDRQIELIDEMEESEQDPGRLDQLFSLDHMATRMKRNQESLLVLADSESPRRGSGGEEIEDVIQVAMGEIEEYRRIDIRKVEQTVIEGNSAGDLAHLLSEILENASSFSAPETKVTVTGGMSETGTYVLTVVDQGIGMDEAQLTIANKLLLEPPDLGLNMGRSLGFAVIGKLAERLEVDVTLVSNQQAKGTTAVIELPAGILAASDEEDNSEQPPAPEPKQAAPGNAATDQDSRTVEAPIVDPLAKFRQEAGDDKLAKLLGGDSSPRTDSSKNATTKGKLGSNAKSSRKAAGDKSRKDDKVTSAPTEAWVPPTVTPKNPAKLEEAVPSGEDFDDGLKGLLEPESPSAPTTLTQRDPGAKTPSSTIRNPTPAAEMPERPTKASNRKPAEIRSMLSKYREGIKSKE